MTLHLSFRKVFNKHSASTNEDTTTSPIINEDTTTSSIINKDTTTSSNITNKVITTKFTPHPSIDSNIEVPTTEPTIRKTFRFKRALKKVTKIIHKPKPESPINSINEVPCYDHYLPKEFSSGEPSINSKSDFPCLESSINSISKLPSSEVEYGYPNTKSYRFKRALKKAKKTIHKSKPRHFIKSIKQVLTYEHANSTNESSIEETSINSISELSTSKVESEFYIVKSSKFKRSFKKIGKLLKKSPKILKKSPKFLKKIPKILKKSSKLMKKIPKFIKNITYIIQNIKFETFIDFITEISRYKVHVGPCFNFFTEILSYKSELETFINSFTEGLSYKGEFDPFINFFSEFLTPNVEPEAPITKSSRFQRILKRITNFIHKVEREYFNSSFDEVLSYESSISSFEVSSYQEEFEPTNEKSSKCISSMKKVRNIIHKNKPEEVLEQSQSNAYSRSDEDSPYEYSSSDKEDCPRDKNILLSINSESTFQSLKKLSKMEKFKRFFNFMRKDPVYQITFTVTNKPLSGPENALGESPMEISSFENPYQESLICEGNIKFKRNAECVAFKTVQLDGTQTSGSKFNFLKRKFSNSYSFCSSPFSSRSTSSSTIPTTAAASIINGLPTNHVHICKSVLKSKNNINYATEAMMCELEDGKDTTKFFEYFIDKGNVEYDREHRKPYTRLGRSKQLDNYYEFKF
ncbi:uncharacterized protein SPAPADRAFT_68222 [Spathaspora passalidarum NRRL Y-27907]|uniref:Uncharacterized protein n=1 Tax=Spathaspora passalidarum (strain NRRL Y-27907 / 11-Y1) TaxID=619300 RepID=G3AS46_SPAPN|nr:uncharacterized protein SPAPADRAFT_68222 [Spathaspora passalidarum NRRL Y-27907]EGW31005.1 hypothetical protein SPAPADRAFT_68222 [Spathaspora passalidarum NRRL Y-27907]